MALSDSLKEARENLPIFRAKKEILQAVYYNKTTIFVGETATGKTTQIPQYLLEGGLVRNKCIAVTQPRRIAAVAIAKRVAEELRTELGGKVGYNVKFENVTSSATKIKYLTDGMLLHEAVENPSLSNYSIVMLDEAHERTLSNDVLFGVVKLAQKIRDQHKLMPLKIIITSATLDYKHLSEYFDEAPVYFISGREFSIKIFNPSKVLEDYVFSALVTVFQIHQKEEEGDILVFCTGPEEIDSMICEVQKTSQNLPSGALKILPCGFFATLPPEQQTDVFRPSSAGCRKVIFTTSIAETSVTIPGIKYVIDTGMVKTKSYNSLCGLDVLSLQKISKAQADQRAGRAGRETDGMCYRLYTLDEFKSFKEYATPEILRCSLSSVILQMVGIGIGNIQEFDFIDKPPEENIQSAIKQLTFLEAITEKDGNLVLTECGQKMVTFPLDPRFSKIIVSSEFYKCTEEILTIISLLSVESVFYTALPQRERFAEARHKFETNEGDHMMLLNVYNAYKDARGNPTWCHENFINSRSIKKAMGIKKQLYHICEKVGINSSSSEDTSKIRKCLASGLFMNAVIFHKNKTFKTVEGNQKVRIHPASCLSKSQPVCCVYTELVQANRIHIRNISLIQEEDLREVAPHYFKDKQFSDYQMMDV